MAAASNGNIFEGLADGWLLCKFFPRGSLIGHHGKNGHTESIEAWLLDILVHFLAIKLFLDKRKHEANIFFRYVARFPELLFKILAKFFDVHCFW